MNHKFRAWTGTEMRLAFDLSQNPKYWWEDNKDYELMQFTGIHDKNGKEIYEGDILKTHFALEDEITQKPFIIAWNKYRAMFEGVKHNSQEGDYLPRFHFFPEQNFIYEVIGNIYENHDLLEDDNE